MRERRNLSINLMEHVSIVELLSTVMHDTENINEIALRSLSQAERRVRTARQNLEI